MDAWTGDITPVLAYSVGNGYTTIPFTLMPEQTNIVFFAKKALKQVPVPLSHVISGSSNVLGYSWSKAGGLIAKVGSCASANKSLVLSTGKRVSLNAASSSARALTNWTLIAEKWLPQDDLYDLEPQANKTNSTHHIPGPVLPSWASISSLANSSGIGYYTTSFSWSPSSSSTTGAYISAPPVIQGMTGFLNGQPLPVFDYANPRLDISNFLVRGENQLVLKASTTLFNSLLPIYDMLQTAHPPPIPLLDILAPLGLATQQPSGIIGEVMLIPYTMVKVAS